MNQTKLTSLAACGAVLLLSGCSIGRNSTLFVTKSNVGLEVASTTPTLQLAISRKEGVVGPQFAGGKKLPVMASFRFGNKGAFAPNVGSAFATGDAATTMAALYGDKTPTAAGGESMADWQGRAKVVSGDLPTDSKVHLDARPDLKPRKWLKWLGGAPTFQANDVRPVFFGTDTAVGLKVTWSGLTGTFPDSANFGYNRKELAYVPVTMQTATDGGVDMKMASLLATVDTGVDNIQTAAGKPALETTHLQYFATGNAATLLSLQQDVRQAMLARLDPNKETFKKVFGGTNGTESRKILAVTFLCRMYGELSSSAPGTVANTLANKLDAAFPAGLSYDFPDYQLDPGRTILTAAPYPGPPAGRPFDSFCSVYGQLVEKIRLLADAIAADTLTTFKNTSVTNKDATRKELTKLRDELIAKRDGLDLMLRDNSAAINEVVQYFYH